MKTELIQIFSEYQATHGKANADKLLAELKRCYNGMWNRACYEKLQENDTQMDICVSLCVQYRVAMMCIAGGVEPLRGRIKLLASAYDKLESIPVTVSLSGVDPDTDRVDIAFSGEELEYLLYPALKCAIRMGYISVINIADDKLRISNKINAFADKDMAQRDVVIIDSSINDHARAIIEAFKQNGLGINMSALFYSVLDGVVGIA